MKQSDLCSTRHSETDNGTLQYQSNQEGATPSDCSCFLTAHSQLSLDLTVSGTELPGSGSECNPCLFIDGPGFNHRIKPYSLPHRKRHQLLKGDTVELSMVNPHRLSHRMQVKYSGKSAAKSKNLQLWDIPNIPG